jgi:hypothetical protein
MAEHFLVVVEGPQPGERLKVGKDPVVIGRRAPADWLLNSDPLVSRRHCRVALENDQLTVVDLNSDQRHLPQRRARHRRGPMAARHAGRDRRAHPRAPGFSVNPEGPAGASKGQEDSPMLRLLALLVAAAALAAPVHAEVRIGTHSSFVGGNVEIDESVDGDVHGAAGRITLNAPVAGSARLAGGHIALGTNAAIAEDASLAGGRIVVQGAVRGDLKAAGGRITIDGPVGGDATIMGGTLDLGPNARIGGKLRFRGGTLEKDDAAQVAGGITHRASRGRDRDHAPFTYSTGRWVWTAGLVLLAAILAAFLPGPSNRMMEELRAKPWMAPLLGFIVLTAVPVAAVLVMVTIIGIPIGLLALLAYAALLLVGYVSAAVVIGGLLLGRFKAEAVGLATWRAGAAVLAMLSLALLARIPYLGGLVQFAALLVGVGLVAALFHRRSPPPAAPSAAAA